ncbi:type II secretion system GspH family protein [Pseudoalteromonas shioyasakiensis]|uniref:type II secretion system protein n=1 Tax=Pseudoalteromonas shioyasakiensis TaxID=1190813 RepID=UPI002117CEA3|nr:type II secretion system protein [Pseudoalteromonas shioyasakiensis]MCQ8879454.1 type II secretion system GspH family protein [Pseudoalteromonas shioyasakiensis]
MMSHSNAKGFSLIELMVVMAIMAIVMGLTGGLVTKAVDQQTRQVELQKVRQLFKRLSYQAYYSGYPIALRMQGSQIKVTVNEQVTIMDFEQLVFSPNDYLIATNSQISPTSYKVLWNDTIKEFQLDSMFKKYEN